MSWSGHIEWSVYLGVENLHLRNVSTATISETAPRTTYYSLLQISNTQLQTYPTMSLKSISGVAFVTGGARGLGNAVAVSFAREGCEAVAIVDVLLDDVMEQGRQEVEKQGAKVGLISMILYSASIYLRYTTVFGTTVRRD